MESSGAGLPPRVSSFEFWESLELLESVSGANVADFRLKNSWLKLSPGPEAPKS